MVGEYQALESEVDEAIKRVLESGWYILGKEVEAFEQEFARYLGVNHAIAVNSGTDALVIALWALDRSGEVIVPSLTAPPTVSAICQAGLKPVFIDVDESYTMNCQQLSEIVTAHTAAIVPVHLYGHPADMVEISTIGGLYNVPVIGDCAQAHGARVGKRDVSQYGKLNAYSFYPTKNLGAFGDAGCVVTDDGDLARKCRELRQYGWGWRLSVPQVSYSHHGINSRMDEMQAAILRVKLPYLHSWNELRRSQGQMYREALHFTDVILPVERRGTHHVYHQFVVRVKNRDRLLEELRENDLPAKIHYPLPSHKQPYYQKYPALPMENTDQWMKEILSLPIGPHITDEEVERTVRIVKRFA